MINLNSKKFNINHWNILHYFDDDLYDLLIAEKKIIANSEKYSSTLIDEFRAKVKNDVELQANTTTYEEREIQVQYYGHYYSDTERLNNQISQNYRKASLLSIFSVLEGQLKLISNLIENEFDFSVKIKHITGSDFIHKYWIYLTKVFELNCKEVENEYNLIRQHKYIRNKVAHNNSEIDNDKLKFVNMTKGLSIKKFGTDNIVYIDNENYINEIIDLIQVFFNKLIIVIDTRYGELKKV